VVAHALVSKAPTVAAAAVGAVAVSKAVREAVAPTVAVTVSKAVREALAAVAWNRTEGVVEWWAVSEEMVEGVRSVTPRGAPVIGVLVGRATGAGGGAEGI
jgi:hypothetical protein